MYWPVITLDTPIEELQRLHRIIWDYVIKYHEKPYNTPYRSDCVACEYAYLLRKKNSKGKAFLNICSHCPIQWSDGLICWREGSLYNRYVDAYEIDDLDAIETIAKEIRDVPWT